MYGHRFRQTTSVERSHAYRRRLRLSTHHAALQTKKHMYACLATYVHVCRRRSCKKACICSVACPYIPMQKQPYTYICTYVCMYVRMHVFMYIYMYRPMYTVSQKKVCKIVSIRTLSNVHQF